MKGDFEFSRDFLTKGDFWEKIYSPFSKGRFWKEILLSLWRREIFKGENLFSLPKGDFEGRISLRILPFTEGRKELPKGENIEHPCPRDTSLVRRFGNLTKCIKLVISLRYFANFDILKSFQKMNAYPHKNQLLRLEVPIWNLSNSIVDPENAFFTFSKNQAIT